MSTIFLLMLSNVFMTFAWYGHLKYGHDWPLWKAILVSWAIALLEYCLAVPANRLGFVQSYLRFSTSKRKLRGIISWRLHCLVWPHISHLRSRHPDP